jgi:hypothetical protein
METSMLSLLMALILATGATSLEAGSDTASVALPLMPRNALYVEAGGAGAFGSLNYDRLLTDRVSIRGGYAVLSYDFLKGVSTNGLLVGMSYRLPVVNDRSRGRGVIALGPILGVSIPSPSDVSANNRRHSTAYTVSLDSGYSYRLTPGGVFIRLSLVPTYSFSPYASGFVPRAGLSFGAVF